MVPRGPSGHPDGFPVNRGMGWWERSPSSEPWNGAIRTDLHACWLCHCSPWTYIWWFMSGIPVVISMVIFTGMWYWWLGDTAWGRWISLDVIVSSTTRVIIKALGLQYDQKKVGGESFSSIEWTLLDPDMLNISILTKHCILIFVR